ncbi:hypothetical protein CC78DRAFT_585985 [Lojkania enalia]|uniref:BZIP domain-containing protein n=1 Tax=Lojkania enalia TaxID=147567 RepID=A0A9P4K4P0_9PLEO|nr:hypothetical protein CC78DRAFT_585985 [Didymosphaeria enalia]
MEGDTADFNWADKTFAALNNIDTAPLEKWNPYCSEAQNYSIPPTLLTSASIERYGQITPPEELSPAEPFRDGGIRESSIPIEQLQNEVSWPIDRAYQSFPEQHSDECDASCPPKRRRISKEGSSANQNGAAPHSSQQTVIPQQPKRKRGRPKSQPQVSQAYTSEGVPFTITSARQNHLEKNRVAAHKCRQRKKAYIEGLESRAREYSGKNKALKENVAMLREEVLGLKNEVLRHAGCGFWAVDEYLARCAGGLLGVGPPAGSPSLSRKPSQTQSSPSSSFDRPTTSESMPREDNNWKHDEEDFGGLELLKNLDDDMEDSDV